MVSIKEATRNAMLFAEEVLGSERTGGMRLEEIESSVVNGDEVWVITLSMLSTASEDSSGRGSSLAGVLGLERRDYKAFTVSKRKGEVGAMKIRALTSA